MEPYKTILQKIQEADAILIGASNGLSITEGLHLFASDQAFFDLFEDFIHKYGIHNILDGCFTRYPTEEEKWAWWSRLIWHYSGTYTGSPVMDSLKKLVQEKPHFIVTSNGEMHFELAGFSPDHIYEAEGSWKHMQCSRACHDTLYPVKDMIREMAAQEKDGKVPSKLVPYCPKCGAPMNIHVAADHTFIPNTAALQKFQDFVHACHNKKLVVLELGIGSRNRMIKAPLMQLVSAEPNSFYITFNKGEIYIPAQIQEKSIGIDGLLSDIFEDLMKQLYHGDRNNK